MAKRPSKIQQRFSADAKQLRAVEREANEAQRVQEKMAWAQSILPDDILAPKSYDCGIYHTHVMWEGRSIAALVLYEGSEVLHLFVWNDTRDVIKIHNVEACRSLLTYQRVFGAYLLPQACANLERLVRQREADAEAEQLRAITGDLPAAAPTTRL